MEQSRSKNLIGVAGILATLVLAACSATPQNLVVPEEQITLQATSTYQARITNSADDAEQNTVTTNTTSAALEIVQNGSGSPQTVGLRFTNVTIPKNAKITYTKLLFVAETNTSATTTLTVQGQAADNAPAFANVANNISSRMKTSASSLWTPGAWVEGEDYSVGVTSSIQEIVNRTGWKSGNSLALVISGSGLRRAMSFDGDPTAAPQLTVTYEIPQTTNPEIEVWQKRLEYAFTHSVATQDAKTLAGTGDLYNLSRRVNMLLTGLTAAYRINKDPDTARYIKEVLDTAYSRLRDTNGDGYRNWLWYFDKSLSSCRSAAENPSNCGTDLHKMDEMMTHAMIAASAYTLKQAGYTSDATKWVNYLKRDFEPKWRKRDNKPSGLPFIEKSLFHPYTQFIRYNYYMYKLTGETAYYNEAKRLAGNARTHVRETTDGGITWEHRIKEGQKSGTGDCPNTTYIPLVQQAFQDLSVADSSLFSDSFMRRLAYSTRTKVLKAEPTNDNDKIEDGSTVYSICGIKPYSSGHPLGNSPYASPAPWDSTGKIEEKQRRAYDTLARQGRYSTNAPAMMILSLGLNK